MISTRRIVAAVGLAVGVTGLAAPLANAADAGTTNPQQINPMTTLDTLAVSDIPAEHRAEVPRVTDQMRSLNDLGSGLNRLNELHQLTDLAAPVTGLLPAVEA
ncbi:hypothetical protein OIB37_33400 [Streptomyces sp. NBC_00820]|uniref:hypothetical protein n=1 Tax=Streptomyces sp. NBC_00820 TaxID=2975842 RepID=UPI002ED34A2C|nr:hypothetical protein OIB37_33400 [Streptomyces sp. NBC_00820]